MLTRSRLRAFRTLFVHRWHAAQTKELKQPSRGPRVDARQRADFAEIFERASLLAAEVIAERDPEYRDQYPPGYRGALGCFLPGILVGVYGWASVAVGPGVALGLGILNWACCLGGAQIGRVREFDAIKRRVLTSTLSSWADFAISSSLVRIAAQDPDIAEVRTARRLETLRADEATLARSACVAAQAMAGRAPIGKPIWLEWPVGTPIRTLGTWISLLLLLGGTIAGLWGVLEWPTIGIGLFGLLSTLTAISFGRLAEFRDAIDRVAGFATEGIVNEKREP